MEEKNCKKENTSEKFTGLKLSSPKKKAAGNQAIISSMQHIGKEMSLVKGMSILNKLNQEDGIDCPGCAWPDPDDHRSKLGEYCENGAKAIAEEATDKYLNPDFFQQNDVLKLSQLSDYEIGKKGRIAQPMYLKENSKNYEEVSWEKAFQITADHLNSLNSPNEAIFYTSGRTSNEAAFLYQLFVRSFGTNNLPDCSNMCHESSGKALSETLGIGKGSVTLMDFYHAEVILVIGQNPGTNHPRMLSALEKAKKNGAKIISINPLKEAGLLAFAHPQKINSILGGSSTLTDHYLQVKINGDLALLQAINALLLIKEKENPGSVFDHEFIQSHSHGFESYIDHIQKLDYKRLLDDCGISEEELSPVIQLLQSKTKIIACWAMGLTQHKNSVDTIKEVVNLLLLKGSIGKKGAGTCPVRGHSNVQGDRTMGIHEKPSKALLDSLENTFDFSVPRQHGFDTVESIKAMHNDKAKIFFGLGGNFLSATPDTKYTAEALEKCNLTVHVSTKLNRSHLVHGKEALILPCLARTDQDIINNELQIVSVENSMGIVHSSRGMLKPFSNKLLSEPAIICHLAKATLGPSNIKWDHYLNHYDHIRESIEATIPGFKSYNKRVRHTAGFYLPNGARNNQYFTKSSKAQFSVSKSTSIELKDDEYLMMTIRSHDQFNTTIYGLDDRYRGIHQERRVILMNKKNIQKANVKPGQVVTLKNNFGGIERIAANFIVVEYDIPLGCVATYFPEANVLVPINSTADKSNTPTSKSVIITIH